LPTQASLERGEQLHTAYDAHKPPVPDDQHLRDLVIVHPSNDFVDRGLFIHAHGIARHDGTDLQGLHPLAHELTFLSSEQPFEQESCGTGHAHLSPVEKIAFRDDSDQRPVVVDYGQSALVGLQQKMDGIEQRRVRFNSREPGSHDIRCQHVRRLNPTCSGERFLVWAE
jgi:hypothetical protein